MLCIAAVAPGGVAQARLLCLRLHARFPELKILVGRWAAQSGIDKIRAQLLASGASEFGTTLEETCDQVAAMRALGLQAIDREQRGAAGHIVDPSSPRLARIARSQGEVTSSSTSMRLESWTQIEAP